MTDKFVVFFGHFYQPPRFNPWLEFVDFDSSASPFHDWNERVAFECYSRLHRAPLHDESGWVTGFINLYSRISFSFGPILLEWLKSRLPKVYNAIIEADKESASREGHGNAIAQPYAHIIMPLADKRYRELAVSWGVRFFEKTFERYPEGFWLPEAAVDNETLEILVDYGIKFVVLAPHQIGEVRVGDRWIRVSGVDPRAAYRVILPSGRSIAAVVYDSSLSAGVSFGDLLDDGRVLASRILESFSDILQGPQLVSIATDGETYGHHKRRGVEELAKAIELLESSGEVRVSNYASFISRAPPRMKARVAERTSWSCPHGVERWRANCGCGSEIRPGWTQEWRGPLRRAVDWLSMEALKAYESIASKLLKDPWGAALNYIDVVYDRSLSSTARFLEGNLAGAGDPVAAVKALKALEALRNALLAQSSDAWFFEDLYRPEVYQILRHAGRALELLESLGFKGLMDTFKTLLREAISNTGVRGDEILEYSLKSRVDFRRLTALYAVKSALGLVGSEARVYSYRVSRSRSDRVTLGAATVDLGIATVISEVTMEQETLYYAAVSLGGWDFYVGVGPLERPEDYTELLETLRGRLPLGAGSTAISLVNEAFKGHVYTVADLPVDDLVDVVSWVISKSKVLLRESLEASLSSITPLLAFLKRAGGRIPSYMEYSLLALLHMRLEECIENLDVSCLEETLSASRGLGLEVRGVGELLASKLRDVLESLALEPSRIDKLELALNISRLAASLGVSEGYLEGARVAVAELRDRLYHNMLVAARLGDELAWRWVKLFTSLAETLRVRV